MRRVLLLAALGCGPPDAEGPTTPPTDSIVEPSCGDGAIDDGEDCDAGGERNAACTTSCASPLPLAAAGADVTLTGAVAGDHAGRDASFVGDVDGDGIDDLLVGAPFAGGGVPPESGVVYLFYGPVSASAALASADATFVGFANGDRAGSSAAPAGDLDGDGLADLAVGASEASQGGVANGAVFLWYGEQDGERSLTDADATLLGEQDGDRAGSEIVPGGSLDGEETFLLVAAVRYDGATGVDAGAVYAIAGDVRGTSGLDVARAVWTGEAAGDFATLGLTGVEDSDGDSLDEIAVGAPYHDAGGEDAGAVYLVLEVGDGVSSLADAPVKWVGTEALGYAGSEVASPGDLDGDGAGDLVVGAPTARAGAGTVYVLTSLESGSLSDAAAKVYGVAADDFAGSDVGAAGDLDGDGWPDVVVAAYGAGEGDAGAAYVLFGPISGTVDLDDAEVQILGAAAGDQFGAFGVDPTGDADGDGDPDVLLLTSEHHADDLGRVYLFAL